MNNQEAIEKIKNIGTLEINNTVTHQKIDMVNKNQVLAIISQLDESQKVVVPQFVADWIEDHKGGDYSKWDEEARAEFVFRSINDLFRFGEGLSPWEFTIDANFSDWTTKNAYKFITAILFDYIIEKEKLYTVEIPNPNKIGNERNVLMKNGFNQIVTVRVYDYDDNWRNNEAYQLTESEIKKDFEWLWQFAEEINEDE